MKNALSLLVVLALSACGVVGNKTISDNTLKNKAAFALNVPAERITISIVMVTWIQLNLWQRQVVDHILAM